MFKKSAALVVPLLLVWALTPYAVRAVTTVGASTFVIDSSSAAATGVAFSLQPAVTASAGVAYGGRFQQTLTASANSDALTALYINPTFADAGHTSVAHNGLVVGSGSVGIGTTAPSSTLEVNGAIRQTPTSLAGVGNYMMTNKGDQASTTNLNPGILVFSNFGGGNNTAYGMDIGYAAGSTGGFRTRVFARKDADIAFSTVNIYGQPTQQTDFTDNMVITSAGNIGIGTITPAATLDVKGHIASSQTTAPTASVTGTGYSGASMASGSTDTKGKITATVGANAGTLVVTFNAAYATAPFCTVTPTTATAQVDVAKMYATTSTTALTINLVATPTGGSESWTYWCVQ